MPERLLRIGVDIDDVLFHSARRTIEIYNQEFSTHLTLNDWYNFSEPQRWKEVWGSDDMSLLVKRVVSINAAESFQNVERIEGAYEQLSRLQDSGHQLFAITGRSESIRPQTMGLLDTSYPDIFTEDRLFFVDHFQHDGIRATKADVAQELELTDFIEDLPEHANGLAAVGIRTWLFDLGYPWAQTEVHPDIIRIHHWGELGERIRAESRAA